MKKLLGVLLVLVYSCTTTNDGTTTTTTVVPLPPTNLVGTLNPLTTVNLSWIDNSTNETGFKIERNESGGDYILIGTTDADKRIFSDSGLSLGVTYTYRVYAYNAVGKSLTYAYSLDINTAKAPVLITTLATLTFGGGASSGGNITDNGGSDVTARGVVWSTNSSPTIDLSTKTVDGGGSGVFTSAISGLTAGTTYYVRAYATNGAGTAYGNQITFTETAVPSNGLVGYWPFNGNANDESGNGNNGTLINGVLLTTDRFNNSNSAYNFDGIDDFIKVLDNNIFHFGTQTSFSCSFWIKYNSNLSLNTIISKETEFNPGYGYQIMLLSNKPRFDFMSDGSSQIDFQGNNTLNDNNWHFVVLTANRLLNQMVFYVDGILNNSLIDNKLSTGDITNSSNLKFGAERSGGGLFYKGLLDDIAIYNRALSQQEITALYNSTGK